MSKIEELIKRMNDKTKEAFSRALLELSEQVQKVQMQAPINRQLTVVDNITEIMKRRTFAMYVDTYEMLKKAREGRYAVGAFNFENMEMALAIVKTAVKWAKLTTGSSQKKVVTTSSSVVSSTNSHGNSYANITVVRTSSASASTPAHGGLSLQARST